MQIISSTEARNNFSELLDLVQKEPVVIQKQGRDSAVVLSSAEYNKLVSSAVENFLEVCENIGSKAAKNGLTESKLAALLKSKK